MRLTSYEGEGPSGRSGTLRRLQPLHATSPPLEVVRPLLGAPGLGSASLAAESGCDTVSSVARATRRQSCRCWWRSCGRCARPSTDANAAQPPVSRKVGAAAAAGADRSCAHPPGCADDTHRLTAGGEESIVILLMCRLAGLSGWSCVAPRSCWLLLASQVSVRCSSRVGQTRRANLRSASRQPGSSVAVSPQPMRLRQRSFAVTISMYVPLTFTAV